MFDKAVKLAMGGSNSALVLQVSCSILLIHGAGQRSPYR